MMCIEYLRADARSRGYMHAYQWDGGEWTMAELAQIAKEADYAQRPFDKLIADALRSAIRQLQAARA